MFNNIIEKAKAMTYKAAKAAKEYLTVSDGNEKLQPTESLKFIIFNIPAVITCPGATKHCIDKCYAKVSEKIRPVVKAARQRNLAATKKGSFVENMIFTIAANLNRPSYQKAKEIVVRIHESGDFYSQEYFDKWLQVAAAFSYDKRVKFIAYTKSVEYVHDIPGNMAIRYSLWDDTEPAQYDIAKEKKLPVYTAVEKFTDEPKKNRCRCADCATCKKCWSALSMIKCEIH